MATAATATSTPVPHPSQSLNLKNDAEPESAIVYRPYLGEADLPNIMALVQSELSEPYVIYTYRYFLHQWPHLSFLAYPPQTTPEIEVGSLSQPPTSQEPVGVIVCKQSMHRERSNRGYIAMLSVNKAWRKRGIARTLVRHSVDVMKENGVDEVILETEYDNAAAISLYESLGFIREKRLFRFYMNGKDAFRLVLALPTPSSNIHISNNSTTISAPSRYGGMTMTNANATVNALASLSLIGKNRDSDSESDDEVSGR